MLVVSAAQLILMQAGSTESVILAGLTSGFGLSIAQPALQALAIDLAPSGRRGAAVATFSAAPDLGILAGTIAAGMIVANASFSAAFSVAAASPTLGLVVLLALQRRTAPRPVVTNVQTTRLR
jgi:predicted MFS family arabinose efflux permease